MSVITIDELDFAISPTGDRIDLRLTKQQLTLLRTALSAAACWSGHRADQVAADEVVSALTVEDWQMVGRDYTDLFLGMRSAEEAMRR